MSHKTNSTLLPALRIRTIMKSSPEISAISQESLYLITKATELFVGCLAQESLKKSASPRNVVYNDLANVVNDEEEFQFLADVVPTKILASEYLEMMKQQEQEGNSGND
ncbi:chromatin accessibility complex protein 1 [Strongylocentrotus purpuratus]|uniref:Chromatin accessibility complex protein 1 n=1 Tax=Strongylocentrotus purpuratus TaxID=7668 RepID=A0A7M7N575_STRPU|nr:chromatin accessibility complex protein 1 [Strongylocentrotus purpuratus]